MWCGRGLWRFRLVFPTFLIRPAVAGIGGVGDVGVTFWAMIIVVVLFFMGVGFVACGRSYCRLRRLRVSPKLVKPFPVILLLLGSTVLFVGTDVDVWIGGRGYCCFRIGFVSAGSVRVLSFGVPPTPLMLPANSEPGRRAMRYRCFAWLGGKSALQLGAWCREI